MVKCIILVALLVPMACGCQQKSSTVRFGGDVAGFHLERIGDKPSLYAVMADVDGRGPFRFLLDTGTGPVVVSPRTAETLGLSRRQVRQRLQGPGGTVGTAQAAAEINELAIGEVVWTGVPVLVTDSPLFAPSENGDVIDGILGFRLFAELTTTIDLRGLRVSVARHSDGAACGGASWPMRLQGGVPEVLAVIGPEMDEPLQVTLAIDTGFNGGFVLPRQIGEQYLDGKKVAEERTAMFFGERKVALHRITTDVVLGNIKHLQPIVSFTDREDGRVGTAVLEKYRIVLMPKTQQAWLAPVKE